MEERAQVILIEGSDGGITTLSERLRTFDVEPTRVANLESAEALVGAQRQAYCVVMIPTDFKHEKLKKALKAVKSANTQSEVVLVSVGRHPTPTQRKELKSAGLKLALWEPYDEGTLRFQLNRAIGGDQDRHKRSALRVPTYLLARVFIGGRTKDAVVYSLSEGGAFLETQRASMEGAQVQVELRLPGGAIEAGGEVLFSNVPGNLQQPNLPLGMGLRFTSIDSDDEKRIRDFVAARYAELNV
jgi:hypothetical protein